MSPVNVAPLRPQVPMVNVSPAARLIVWLVVFCCALLDSHIPDFNCKGAASSAAPVLH